MLFRTLPVAPGCNKVPEKEKTSGNHYKRIGGEDDLSFHPHQAHFSRQILRKI